MSTIVSPLNKILQLPAQTARQITSGLVVTSVFSVVKELIENSLDAEASSIDIKLEDSGWSKTEVRDNGKGVSACDVPKMVLPHTTSKITHFEDLQNLTTYGFRGEALSALCESADVEITTKTHTEEYSTLYIFDNSGLVIDSKPSAAGQGTTITVKNLFKKIPVRRQMYNPPKKKKADLKKVEDVAKIYSLIYPMVRFALHNDRHIIWQKTAVPDLRSAMMQVVGSTTFGLLNHFMVSDGDTTVETYLPKYLPENVSSSHLWKSTMDSCFVCVNKRPIYQKEVIKLLADSSGDKVLYPTCFVSVSIPNSKVDFNLDANKTSVLFDSCEHVFSVIKTVFDRAYNLQTNEDTDKHREQFLQDSKQKNHNRKKFSEHADSNTDTELPEKNNHSEGCCISTTEKNNEVNPIENFNSENLTSEINGRTTSKPRDPLELEEVFDKSIEYESTTSHASALLCIGRNQDQNLISSKITKTGERLSNHDSNNTTWDLNETSSEGFTALKDNTGIALSKETAQDSCTVRDELHKEGVTFDREIDLNQTETSTWSRGNIVNRQDERIEPIQILMPSKRPITPPPMPVTRKRKCDTDVRGQRTMQEMFSAITMKPKGAFELFVQEHRLDVRKEHPEASLTEVAEKLLQKWKQLGESEHKKYEQMVTNQDKAIHKSNQQENTVAKIPTAATKLQERKNKSEIVVHFSLSDMTCVSHLPSDMSYEKAPKIIGHLNGRKCWLGVYDNTVVGINHFRLQETVLYHKLLKTHKLPMKKLDEQIVINETPAGKPEFLKILLDLSSSVKGRFSWLHDQRLIANGFMIRTHIGSNGSMKAEIVEMCDLLPYYGINDLVEVLQKMSESKTVEQCRPLKVLHYLKGEAVRMVRNLPLESTKDEIEEILEEYRNLNLDSDYCFHDRPFFHAVHTLD